MQRIRSHVTYANVMATIAVFLVLSGGTAVALTGSNTVQSDDLGPGSQVRAPDVAADAVNGSDIVNNSVTGADVSEPTLSEVPSAKIGGLGRWTGTDSGVANTCDASSGTFVACAGTTVNLPRPSRVLVIGEVQASTTTPGGGTGQCRIATTSGSLTGTMTEMEVAAGPTDNTALVGITGVLPAGERGFRVDCNQTGGTSSISAPESPPLRSPQADPTAGVTAGLRE
jgi:hypothetical protein